MRITETRLAGAFVIEPERREDPRGFFAQLWTEQELSAHGMAARFVQCNTAHNLRRGTLRGMHYQAAPHGQDKLISCTAGAIYDVGVDLRPHSPTFRQWVGVELSAENRRLLYLPGDFAHGYQTLTDGAEVLYLVSAPWVREAERGVRWDDPAFGIQWPETGERIMNARDREYGDFDAKSAT